jgi:enoyl-CoA hydratase
MIRLPAEVGRFRAKELLMLCRFLSAEEAHQWGIVMKVVPHEQLLESAMEQANIIKKMPPLSIRAIKQGINRGVEGYEYASQVMKNLQKTEDAKEGARAFIEKREPYFQGK